MQDIIFSNKNSHILYNCKLFQLVSKQLFAVNVNNIFNLNNILYSNIIYVKFNTLRHIFLLQFIFFEYTCNTLTFWSWTYNLRIVGNWLYYLLKFLHAIKVRLKNGITILETSTSYPYYLIRPPGTFSDLIRPPGTFSLEKGEGSWTFLFFGKRVTCNKS